MLIGDLIGNLIYARSGWGDWAKRAKAAGLPGWPQTFETAGALVRLPSYKETVPLSLAESPRYTTQLWRLLQKAKRQRQARHRLTQEHVDYLMKRRMKEWWKSLRMLRMYGTVRAD